FTNMEGFERVDDMRPGPDFPPFAVVWGASNLGLNPRAGAALNETLRPDRIEFLPGCGHLPMMEESDVVTAIIEDFVENPPARSASARC
ncbi:alpha/beta fold hydrolase, partial [Mycobacterium kansasii]